MSSNVHNKNKVGVAPAAGTAEPSASRGSAGSPSGGSTIHDSFFIDGGRIGFLLAHSLGGSPAELRYLAQNLARAGYTVSCPLLAGHGSTRNVLDASAWSDWYSSLVDAHERLRKHCDTIVVGGLSAGGVMTLRLAAEHPGSVAAVTLFSPTLWPDGWAIPKTFKLFRLVRHKWFAKFFFFRESAPHGLKDERMRRFVTGAIENQPGMADRLSGFTGGTILEFRWMVEAVRSALGSVKQPVLIVHPREDDRSSLANAAELQRRLGGIVETVVIDDSYHVCTLDKQRDLVVERAMAFADRTVDRPARHAATGGLRLQRG